MARLSRYRTIYDIDGQTMNHHTSSVFVRRFYFPFFDFKLEGIKYLMPNRRKDRDSEMENNQSSVGRARKMRRWSKWWWIQLINSFYCTLYHAMGMDGGYSMGIINCIFWYMSHWKKAVSKRTSVFFFAFFVAKITQENFRWTILWDPTKILLMKK